MSKEQLEATLTNAVEAMTKGIAAVNLAIKAVKEYQVPNCDIPLTPLEPATPIEPDVPLTPLEPSTPIEPEPTPDPVEPANPNLFDLSTVTYDVKLNSNGKVEPSKTRAISDWIKAEGGEYTITASKDSLGTYNAFDNFIAYDENKKFIERVSTGTVWTDNGVRTVTAPANTAYIRLNMYDGDVAKGERMIVKGNKVLPYQEYRSNKSDTVPEPVEPKPEPQPVPKPTPKPDTGVVDGDKVVPDPNMSTIYAKDYQSPEDALNAAARLGGANIVFPSGKFEVALYPKAPNIRLFGTGETYFYAKSSSAVLEVRDEGRGFQANGVHFRGQTLAQANSGSKDVTSIYCMWIWGDDCKFSNFTTEGAIYDSLYLRGGKTFNFKATNFFINTTNRNPVTWVSGLGVTLKNGSVRMNQGEYLYVKKHKDDDKPTYGGLYLFDCEPNDNPMHQYGKALLENVTFINANGAHEREQIVLQDNKRNNGNYIDIEFRNCKTVKEGEGDHRAPYIRTTSDTKQKVMRGIRVIGGEYNNRVIMGSYNVINSDGSKTKVQMQYDDTLIEGVTLGTYNQVTYANSFGDGSVIKNVTTKNKEKVAKIKTTGNAKVLDVIGHTNIN